MLNIANSTNKTTSNLKTDLFFFQTSEMTQTLLATEVHLSYANYLS